MTEGQARCQVPLSQSCLRPYLTARRHHSTTLKSPMGSLTQSEHCLTSQPHFLLSNADSGKRALEPVLRRNGGIPEASLIGHGRLAHRPRPLQIPDEERSGLKSAGPTQTAITAFQRVHEKVQGRDGPGSPLRRAPCPLPSSSLSSYHSSLPCFLPFEHNDRVMTTLQGPPTVLNVHTPSSSFAIIHSRM